MDIRFIASYSRENAGGASMTCHQFTTDPGRQKIAAGLVTGKAIQCAVKQDTLH